MKKYKYRKLINKSILDSKKSNHKIFNISDINKLKDNDKILFDFCRCALLEIFPLIENKIKDEKKSVMEYHPMSLNITENFAYILTIGLSEYIENRIKSSVELQLTNQLNNESFKNLIDNLINEKLKQTKTNSNNTGPDIK